MKTVALGPLLVSVCVDRFISKGRLAPTVALLLLIPAGAYAQVVEVRGGVTTAPVVGFGGVRIESTPKPEKPITFGASLDYGRGHHPATFFTLRVADYWLGKAHPSLEFKSWSPRIGLGLSLLVSRDLAPFHGGDGIGGY